MPELRRDLIGQELRHVHAKVKSSARICKAVDFTDDCPRKSEHTHDRAILVYTRAAAKGSHIVYLADYCEEAQIANFMWSMGPVDKLAPTSSRVLSGYAGSYGLSVEALLELMREHAPPVQKEPVAV